MAKPVIIYDYLNTLVWVDGEPGYKQGDKLQKIYGSHAKRFKSNVQARSYAIRLAKLLNGRVWDKYYGEYLGEKKKESKPKFNSNDPLGMQNSLRRIGF